MAYEFKTASEGYVHLKHPILGVADQKLIPLGERRTAADGEIETLFFPIEQGYYQDKVWLRREQIT